MNTRSTTVAGQSDVPSTDLEGTIVSTSHDQQPPVATGDRRRREGRGPSVLVTVLVSVIVALIAVTATVLIMAPRGREAVEVAPPASTTRPSEAPSTGAVAESPTSSPPAPEVTADGCLGGAVELNRAVIAAQEQAPLTGEGAAAFTATLLRWTMAAPAPAYKADTARQVLAQDATPIARDLTAVQTPSNQTASADFTSGRFYVESYEPTRAVISFLATGLGTQDGVELTPATIAGAVTLVAQNGTWHFQDLTSERTVSDLLAVSSPYTGGC